jgi:pyruvate dehydrogenase E2 component (dihydrolipoamide acetyltransferase)
MAEIIRMPRLSDTMEEGNIVGWLKKVGDKVKPGDILAEVETDKATMELESFHEGYLLHIGVPEGPAPVNALLAIIGDKGEDVQALLAGAGNGAAAASPAVPAAPATPQAAPAPVASAAPPAAEAATAGDNRIKASPLARTLAAEAGVDLSRIPGSGDSGRIVKRDVEAALASGAPAAESRPAVSNVPAAPQYGEVPVSQMRKTIARRLAESKFGAPHFYLTIKINMDRVAEARKAIQDQTGGKVSVNDFVIKACALALRQHPAVNSSWLGDKIRINKDINIGVAVAVEDGLLVPVLFAADRLGLAEIGSLVGTLAEKARNKKLQPQEMQGNTFSVSNLGMFGIEEFTAIINPPDAGILAIGNINEELRLDNGQVTSSKMMKVTMSCDHRVIDGATGAKFLQTFRQYLENPVSMLL